MIFLHIRIDYLAHHIDFRIPPLNVFLVIHRTHISRNMCIQPSIYAVHRRSDNLIKEIFFIYTMPIYSRSRHTAALADTSHGRLIKALLHKFGFCCGHNFYMIGGFVSRHGFLLWRTALANVYKHTTDWGRCQGGEGTTI